MTRFLLVLLVFPNCYDTEPPSEWDCLNVCEAKVKAAQAEAQKAVQKAKDTCVRETPPKNGSSRQLSSRSYSHPKDWSDMIVETKVRVWRHPLGKPQRITCFYYDGDRTDAYLNRDSTVVQVGAVNPLDVTVIARLRKVPSLLRVGQRMVRTECGVFSD